MWGTRWRQRLRLGPLYLALRAADALSASPRPAKTDDCEEPRRPLPRSNRKSWRPGLSIVIPDRDAPDLLATALASIQVALEPIDEAAQIIVVANGAPESTYAGVRAAFPGIELVHSDPPLAFGAAIARGLAQARHDWVFLMNNDMTLDRAALFELAARRDDAVFSVSAQIFQRSADGRREETGFTDWYIDRDGVHVFHAPITRHDGVYPHLAGSGG